MVCTNVLAQVNVIKIEFPSEWISKSPKNVITNRSNDKVVLTDSLIAEVEKGGNGQHLLYWYVAPKKVGANYQPNIRVSVYKNTLADTLQMLEGVQNSLDKVKSTSSIFTVLEKPVIVNINGWKAAYTVFSGAPIPPSSKFLVAERKVTFYLIRVSQYIYHVHFMDNETYDCSREFREVLESMKF